MKSAVLSGGTRCPSRPSRAFRVRLNLNLLGWLVPLLVLVWSTDAHAYAWMIRHGYTKCDTCHTDPSGGEALNHMGRVQSQQLLSYDWGQGGLTDNTKFMYGLDEPDHFRAGGSVRGMTIYKLANEGQESKLSAFPMQMDLYGSADFGHFKAGLSIGLGKVTSGSGHVQAAQLTKGTEGYVAVSRSHWIGYEIADRWLVRAGRLNLPFGIRTSEHTLFARAATQTDRESHQQHGLALAYSGGSWRGEGMFVLGNFQLSPDDYRERGFTGYLEYLLSPTLAVGASTLILQSAKSLLAGRQERTIRHLHGLTARYVPLDALVVLAELDALKMTGRKLGYTGFVTGDYELLRGVHVSATGEVYDGGRIETLPVKVPGAGEMNYALWATGQWFFYTHWDFRADLLLNKGGGKSIQGQIHTYF